MASDNLYARLRAHWPANGDEPFLINPDGPGLSYAALEQLSAKIAGLLRDLGLTPGDRVALQAEKSVTALVVYLGVLRAGGVFLPLNPAYTLHEVAYFLGDATPAIVILAPGDTEREAVARNCGARAVFTLGAGGVGSLTDALDTAKPDFDVVPREPDDLAAILYTSGTTGRSKGAMLSHRALWSNAQTLRDAWRFTSADRLLHALPIFHTHGLFVATNVTLAAGSALIFQTRFDARALMREMPRATVLMGVPTFYTRLLGEADFGREQTASMRLFISGSAPLPSVAHDAFQARTGHAILERYGMTETNMNTSNPYDGLRKPGSVGPPLAGVEVRIRDVATGENLTDGAVGQIEIRGPNLFSGYWKMPDKTAEDMGPDGFFKSGDLGFIDDDGYVHIVGRAKDLIIAGGFNIYPAEVEGVLERMAGVADCAVVGAPHPDLGEAVVALVVAKPGSGLDQAAVMAAFSDTLARFKRPRAVIFRDVLPRNAMGKVQKSVLRDELKSLFAED